MRRSLAASGAALLLMACASGGCGGATPSPVKADLTVAWSKWDAVSIQPPS